MKRLFSFMMALVLLLSMAVTASAATTGSIKITNAALNDTYSVYKIFDAKYVDSIPAVTYSISPTIGDPAQENKIFTYMFGADGKSPNTFFTYDALTGLVSRKAGTDKEICEYLADMIRAGVHNGKAAADITATVQEIEFKDLPYGYYLIDKAPYSTDVAVTIDSNTPNVEVIDKNQSPNSGEGFDKKIVEGSDRLEMSDAFVGDTVDWELTFNATNYDGENLVKYYTIRDKKSSALWVEFNSIEVHVGTEKLGPGYYINAGAPGIDTGDWTNAKVPAQWAANSNEAAWYLIHYNYDEFEIVIPWLDDYTITGKTDPIKGYDLTFDLSTTDGNTILSESKYAASAKVTVKYSAAVGPGAANTVSTNSATLKWLADKDPVGPEDPEVTQTKVYNLGITKTADDAASSPLAGATFKLWKTAVKDPITGEYTYSDPVNVIPTNNEGVYILDDIDIIISGENRQFSREMYAGHWESYIIADPEPQAPAGSTDDEKKTLNRRNDMTTPASGQLVILGLDSGTYYLEESHAPTGYNRLTSPVTVTTGSGVTTDYNNGYTDLSGNPITYKVYSVEVENKSGKELPSTGGEGTVMMITFGTMVAMAFAVLMITQKKMSVYHD